MRVNEFLSENETSFNLDEQGVVEGPDNNAVATAKRMIERYSGMNYTPYERASDHAMSYDRGDPRQQYWLEVADEIRKLEGIVNEIKMSPGRLRSDAANIDAWVGMEFEMIVPIDFGGDAPSEIENMEYDGYITSLDSIEDFFITNGYNTRKEVNRAIAAADKKFNEWKKDQAENDWESNKDSYEDTKEEFMDEWEETNDSTDLLMRFLEEENIDTYSEFGSIYSLIWPFYTADEEKVNLKSVASSFGKALGVETETSDLHGQAPRGDWYSIEPDSSVKPEKAKDPTGWGLEFISPPQSIDKMVSDLIKVRQWAIANNCYTNNTTGLHIGVSLPGRQKQVDYIKLALLLGDQYVLKRFGRLLGNGAVYAASAVQKLRRDAKNYPLLAARVLDEIKTKFGDSAKTLIASATYDRNISINPRNTYIEFRSPGGDWLGTNFKEIESTINRFVVALDAAADPNKYKNEYLRKLYKLLQVEEAAPKSNIDLFASYVAGNITKTGLIKKLKARRKPVDSPIDILNPIFVNENRLPKIGINVRNDGMIEYADMIVDGDKKLESRNSDSLRPYVNKRVSIVRTGSGPAQAIGEVTIGEPIKVDEQEFRRLEKQHKVPAGSKFDIKANGIKYLYPMISPVRYEKPKKVGKGIVSRKVIQRESANYR